MRNFLSDLLAYLWVGAAKLASWLIVFGDDDSGNGIQALDSIEQATQGNRIARRRYKMNRLLGGNRTPEYYASRSNDLQGCLAGLGCIVLLIAAFCVGIFLLL